MKMIINGFRYDTSAPNTELTWEYSYGNASDFRHEDFGVYRTARGHWFLAGSGGAMTRFGRAIGDNAMAGSARIIPLHDAQEVLDLASQCQLRADIPETFWDYPEIVALIEDA